MSITLNNARNNNRFIYLLTEWANEQEINFKNENHFRCFAHVLNIALQEALKFLTMELNQV